MHKEFWESNLLIIAVCVAALCLAISYLIYLGEQANKKHTAAQLKELIAAVKDRYAQLSLLLNSSRQMYPQLKERQLAKVTTDSLVCEILIESAIERQDVAQLRSILKAIDQNISFLHVLPKFVSANEERQSQPTQRQSHV